MLHRIKWALVVAAAAGFAAVPTVASAQSFSGNVGTVIVGDHNQVAGDDIINAGCDANVGSFNGSHDEHHHGRKCDRDEDRDHGDKCDRHHHHHHGDDNGRNENGRDDEGRHHEHGKDSDENASGNFGTVIVGDHNQVAGKDIINAGRDVNLGSFNGSDLDEEMGSLLSGL
ncbi:hypothetical protein E6W39_03440 [Kitasatospora acidiphila]|uniref:Uncharacterized protein n=1 Tax=Kitasatospora acidiphila TaxID=2567942 RepID=A0A540VXJ8_9ACTN|nr:hypothetical protein [Kitasatospora acidiphila]TQF01471.1 hypothetical protein E6W39_03440 [Kitasatospora acidiphila]